MDTTALNELIAQVRGTAATLAEAEQRVAAFKNELAQQKLSDAGSALLRATPMPKRASSGWLPANRQNESNAPRLKLGSRPKVSTRPPHKPVSEAVALGPPSFVVRSGELGDRRRAKVMGAINARSVSATGEARDHALEQEPAAWNAPSSCRGHSAPARSPPGRSSSTQYLRDRNQVGPHH
jgi:hypothetical protein